MKETIPLGNQIETLPSSSESLPPPISKSKQRPKTVQDAAAFQINKLMTRVDRPVTIPLRKTISHHNPKFIKENKSIQGEWLCS